jgi:hypothetical protein
MTVVAQDAVARAGGLFSPSPLLIPFFLFDWISRLIWRFPGRDAMKMAEFSHVELGSGLDMLAAVKEAPDPLLKRKYFRHALDELKHSRMFRDRARALALRSGVTSLQARIAAVLDDTGYIPSHGINESTSLYSRTPELQFLAFVWLHERAGATQFSVYSELMAEDSESCVMFDEIARDERFHIAYARSELERRAQSSSGAVWRAIAMVRLRDYWQAWGRLAFGIGNVMSGIWLGLLYFLVVGPFALLARQKTFPTGLVVAGPSVDPKSYAQQSA